MLAKQIPAATTAARKASSSSQSVASTEDDAVHDDADELFRRSHSQVSQSVARTVSLYI